MSIKVVAGIVSLCLGLSGLGLANIFLWKMIGEINRKRPDGKSISYVFTTFKTLDILSEYRRLYPGGKLLVYVLVSTSIGMLGMIGSIVCLVTIR